MPHSDSKRRKPAAVAVLVILLACTGLAACGGSSSSSTSTSAAATSATATTGTATKAPNAGRGGGARFSSPAFKTALAKFATCLRQNGVNLPAPNTSGKGPVFDTKGIDTSSAQFKAAETKCQGVLSAAFRRGPSAGGPGGGNGGAPSGGGQAPSGGGTAPPAG